MTSNPSENRLLHIEPAVLALEIVNGIKPETTVFSFKLAIRQPTFIAVEPEGGRDGFWLIS